MDIVKKNLVSIICGVIAIAALVAVFVWPLDGYYEELKGKADKRAGVLAKINALRSKTRVLPVFDPNNPTAAKLTKFPSKDIITKGEAAQKAVRLQSIAMYEKSLQLNQMGHGLVVPGILPQRPSESILIAFRTKVTDALDRLRTDELGAGVPPTEKERKLREDALWEVMKKEIIVVDGQPTNLERVTARFEAEKAKLPDLMKKEMATRYKMYIDPATIFVPSDSLPKDGKAPTHEAVWWSQVAFWIESDATSAIKELNANSTSVLDSPIKNLVEFRVPEDFFPPIMNSGGARAPDVAGGDAATVATGGRPDPTIALPDGGSSSPTKRVSNNLFDVVQFKMTVDIEADKIPLFLKTLATDRFITVIRVEMNPVDSQQKQRDGFVYGPRPVVSLILDCEALFMREWTIKLMPEGIRNKLGIPDVNSGAKITPAF
jgi:hypothetical protein